MAGSVTVINGGVKGIKNECQLMERCDGHGGGVRGLRGVMVIREVFGGMGRLSRSVTVLRRCVSWWGGVMVMGKSKRA